jgi:HEAT repeat protein
MRQALNGSLSVLILFALVAWPARGSSATAAAALKVAGLDSLSNATLACALEYLQIAPEELGFDKLYAEDDTFRLAIVEELLNDPLRIPGWQTETITRLHETLPHWGDLTRLLGGLAEAPDPRAQSPHAALAPRTQAASARDTARPVAFAPNTPPHTMLAPPVERFIAQCAAAETALQAAFARFDPALKSKLLIAAPAFWGDSTDPLDKVRNGRLHFELGAPVDTALEITEDHILDLAVTLDRPALTRAAALFYDALGDLETAVANLPLPAATETMPGVTGSILTRFETPWGLLVIGGADANAYDEAALRDIAFLIELGGNDRYRGRAASAVGDLLRPFGALVDLAGDDIYEAGDRDYVLGGALLGVAALIDEGGNDVYRAHDGSLGAGFFGVGLLCDAAGRDFFEGGTLCEGSGAFGLGALVSWASDTAPPGPELDPDRAWEAGLFAAPGTGAVPVRYDDNDFYICARESQGFASTFGAGLLYDRTGNDTYSARGRYRHTPLRPNDFQSLSQGFSIGFRPRAGGGVGILMDDAGNDFYDAEIYAQGAGYWYSIGLLYDGAGQDSYHATQYAQAAGVHLAIGSLWDRAGEDQYVAHFGVTQGTGHDLSAAWLIDESGDDYYVVSDGQAVSLTNSASFFIDGMGNDLYAVPGIGQGALNWARGFSGAAIFLDLEGKDAYPRGAPAENGAVWTSDLNAIGIDLDRDVELPGEVVPEVVLTKEDSLRTVEELFKTASIWNVGSAREKVARAHKALLTKGVAAVDYVVAEKLATKDGLEFRIIADLAQANPDSFAARVIPRLTDPDEQTRRNVIGILGEMRWKPAVPALGALLRDKKQERVWTKTIESLGMIGDRAGAPAVRPFVRDEKERRRIYSLAALASLKDSTSVPALVAALSDPLLTVRSAAKSALQSFGAYAIPPLCASLGQAGEHRIAKLHTLGALTAALADSTDAESLAARSQARRALMANLDRPISETLPAERAAALDALLRLGDAETAAFVRLKMLDESDPLVRRAYDRALERKE